MNTYKVSFTDDADAALASLSDRMGVPRTEVLRDALSLYKWLYEEHVNGARLGIERPVQIARLPFIGPIMGHEMTELVIDFGEAAADVDEEVTA